MHPRLDAAHWVMQLVKHLLRRRQPPYSPFPNTGTPTLQKLESAPH
ncbi:hypothetical protein ACOMHN_026074 [Nucella lapillus]